MKWGTNNFLLEKRSKSFKTRKKKYNPQQFPSMLWFYQTLFVVFALATSQLYVIFFSQLVG